MFFWRPENNAKFHLASLTIWLLASCYLARQFGSFQLPLFVLLQVVLLAGLVYELYFDDNENTTTEMTEENSTENIEDADKSGNTSNGQVKIKSKENGELRQFNDVFKRIPVTRQLTKCQRTTSRSKRR